MPYTEYNYENAVITLFEQLGYAHVYAPDIARDYANVLYEDELLPSLRRVNPHLPEVAIAEAVYRLKNFDSGSLTQKNRVFTDYLQYGISVNYLDGGEQKADLVRIADFANPDNNNFIAANQWTMMENSEKRPDILIFLNGIPIVDIELKSPSREETDASEAYRQLRNYMLEIPSLFIYNAFCVMSDLAVSKAGTLTSGEDRFMEWKTADGSYENTQYAQFDTFFEGMFTKPRLLDILKNFICYSEDKKILTAYHQYYAVCKAAESTVSATNGRGGVFWHTQGSGKSLSMVFYAHLLQEMMNSPTIVVLTDRNDLDGQLYTQFSNCADFLRQTPVQAKSRVNLKELLVGRQANGIIFTTMQKFTESAEPLSTRSNIVVMADEAHRGQWVNEKIDTQSGRVVLSTARIIRDSLPNATYIGFTGTPISAKDRSTIEVFGDCIDIYDMTQAVEDGATRPVYYENRVIRLKLDEDILKLIDAQYDIMAQNAEPYAIEKSKHQLSQMDSVLGAPETLGALCHDIIDHYEQNRANLLTGKAMIVAYSRPIAMKIYEKLLELRPAWKEKVGVVMTSDNDDPEEWRAVIGNKHHKEDMARRFKDDEDGFKIAIVVDMWLTGFDVPSLATMYVYKPMAGHNLMQAIARVNRVYKDKEGGLVVDYVGIATALKQAMNDYTTRDKHNYGEQDIAKTALPKFLEKLEVCRDLFHGFNYSAFADGSDYARAKVITGGVNYLLSIETNTAAKNTIAGNCYQPKSAAAEAPGSYGGTISRKEAYIKEAMLLRQALSLCRSLLDKDKCLEAAYFEAVRTLLTRVADREKKLSIKEINAAINELLKASVKSEGVINLFSDANKDFSLFDPKFLEEISKMKERNLAVELLKKLIAEQVSLYRRTNLVKSEKFSEMLSRVMNGYLKGMLSNEEVIAELMKMAREMANAREHRNELGLTLEEQAFYDALTQPQAVKDFYENDTLVQLTRELTEALRKNRTIDWQRKETARAGMRSMVKRLLKRYKYPPEGVECALNTVIGQCEMWADN